MNGRSEKAVSRSAKTYFSLILIDIVCIHMAIWRETGNVKRETANPGSHLLKFREKRFYRENDI
jgi:hypothetical protein